MQNSAMQTWLQGTHFFVLRPRSGDLAGVDVRSQEQMLRWLLTNDRRQKFNPGSSPEMHQSVNKRVCEMECGPDRLFHLQRSTTSLQRTRDSAVQKHHHVFGLDCRVRLSNSRQWYKRALHTLTRYPSHSLSEVLCALLEAGILNAFPLSTRSVIASQLIDFLLKETTPGTHLIRCVRHSFKDSSHGFALLQQMSSPHKHT